MMYASGFFPLVSAVQRSSAAVAAALGQAGQVGQVGQIGQVGQVGQVGHDPVGDIDVDGDSDDNDVEFRRRADDDGERSRINGEWSMKFSEFLFIFPILTHLQELVRFFRLLPRC